MKDKRSPLRNGTLLAGFALLAALLLAGTWLLTSDLIFDQERRHLLAQLEDLLPPEYDNDPLDDVVYLEDSELLGTSEAVPVYRARRGGAVVAVMLTAVAPDGYSGPISLLLGISADGTLLGVRVLAHKETPGLGDFIDLKRSEWIRQFEGRSLKDPPPERWAVARDGGEFDQVTGATVTARAVTNATAAGLRAFEKYRERVTTAQSETKE